MGVTLGPSNEVTGEGLPVLFIKDLPPVSSIDAARHAAADLLRRAVERLRARAEPAAGVRLSGGRGRRGGVLDVRRTRRRAGRLVRCGGCCSRCASGRSTSCSRATSRTSTRILYYRDVARARGAGAAVPGVRSRSVHGDRERRPAEVDARRVHDDGPLPVLAADRRRHRTTCATASRS